MTASSSESFRFEDAPMAYDRAAGWRFVKEYGDVVQAADGTWYLTSAEAVQFALSRPAIFSSAEAFRVLGSPVPLIPLAVDPPDHKKFRRVLDPMIAPRVVNSMEDELRRQVRDLIAAFADKGECEIVGDLGRLYPTQVFLTLFGMPLEDRDRFIGWAETIIEGTGAVQPGEGPGEQTAAAAGALFGYLQGFVDEKRARPDDDMLSRVLSLAGDDAWSNEEVLGMCFLFVLAGLDTVTAAIGFVMLHLAQDAELRQRLVSDPSLVPAAIEEILRLELPAPTTPRIVQEDVDVCGVRIPAGSAVTVCLAAANRDSSVFAHPDDLDLAHGKGHLSFGGGVHRCLGSHLARRELRLVVEEFHALIPDYELKPGSKPHVVWPSGTLHLESLPLVFPAGAR